MLAQAQAVCEDGHIAEMVGVQLQAAPCQTRTHTRLRPNWHSLPLSCPVACVFAGQACCPAQQHHHDPPAPAAPEWHAGQRHRHIQARHTREDTHHGELVWLACHLWQGLSHAPKISHMLYIAFFAILSQTVRPPQAPAADSESKQQKLSNTRRMGMSATPAIGAPAIDLLLGCVSQACQGSNQGQCMCSPARTCWLAIYGLYGSVNSYTALGVL